MIGAACNARNTGGVRQASCTDQVRRCRSQEAGTPILRVFVLMLYKWRCIRWLLVIIGAAETNGSDRNSANAMQCQQQDVGDDEGISK